MRLDPSVRRFFPILVAAIVAFASYLQAWGIGRLVALAVPRRPPVAAPAAALAVDRAVDPTHERSARPILERNPFDSITGPLVGNERVLDHPMFTGRGGEPLCDDARVLLIAASSEKRGWSFAALAGRDGTPVLRREGDDFGGRAVVAIGWDRVWLAKGGERCRLELGQPAPRPTGPVARSPARPAGSGEIAGVVADLRSHIRATGPFEWEIERATMTTLLDRYPELIRGMRLSPGAGGAVVRGIRAGSVPEALGLRDGDRLVSLNGHDLADPRSVVEAYAGLIQASRFSLVVRRGDAPLTLGYTVR